MPLTHKTPSVGDALISIQQELQQMREELTKKTNDLNNLTEFLRALLKIFEETHADATEEKKET